MESGAGEKRNGTGGTARRCIREADTAGALAKASNVSYELRIYQALQTSGGWIPGALAYARDGLSATSHRVESPLEPCARYF